jgi:ferritin
MIIKKTVQDALNKQIVKEFDSGYLYLSMAAYFESQNLKGFAAWMRAQAGEEHGHGMKMFNYIYERGGKVTLGGLAKPKSSWKSALEAFEDSYAHEKEVTKLIDGLVALARKEKDNATEAFLQWYVTEQVEEEATSSGIAEKLRLMKNAPGGIFLLDRELGQRGAGGKA